MFDKNANPATQDKLRQLLLLVNSQDTKIAELQTHLKSSKSGLSSTYKYFVLYQNLVRTIREQGLVISRKYRTENSVIYIDAPYAIYRDFVSVHLDSSQHRTFKEFLLDFRLAETSTFSGSGLYIQTAETGKTRIVRIRADLVKWLT